MFPADLGLGTRAASLPPAPSVYEATRRDQGPGPWCVVSSNPADLWRELAGRAPPAAPDSDEPDHALLPAARTIGSHPAARIPPCDDAEARSTAK